MNKITVVGTFHTEGGACTSDELLKIIQKISPNVIFCEAAPENFHAMLKAIETFNPPEIKALRTIIQNSSIDIIPVDVYGDPFDGRLEAMLELFRNKSKEYYYASEIQAGETHLLLEQIIPNYQKHIRIGSNGMTNVKIIGSMKFMITLKKIRSVRLSF